jgi:DNA-directed RNA polymerase subunit RPC12/RpoP
MKCPDCSTEMKFFFEPSNDETPHKDGYKCPSCGTFKQTVAHYMSLEDEETWTKALKDHEAYIERHPTRFY